MNADVFLFVAFNTILGLILIRRAVAILVHGRMDHVKREYGVAYANPALVAKQIGYVHLLAGISLYLVAVIVIVVMPTMSLKAMITTDFPALAPVIIWKFFINWKHDRATGQKPVEELSGMERAFLSLNERLDAGEMLLATVTSTADGAHVTTSGLASRRDGGIALEIKRDARSATVSTETHQFSTAAEFSRYLEQHTVLRLGDFGRKLRR